jgi:predicted esterase
MICRVSLLLAGSLVMGCAPAFPPKPELPPISAQMGTTGTHGRSAPVIPKPDLSTVSSEVRAAGNPTPGSARVATPGNR